MRAIVRILIRLYQVTLSPLLAMLGGSGCRFSPTCSEYCLQAVDEFGVRRGLWLASRRLLRCHPWGGSGLDPIPLRGK